MLQPLLSACAPISKAFASLAKAAPRNKKQLVLAYGSYKFS